MRSQAGSDEDGLSFEIGDEAGFGPEAEEGHRAEAAVVGALPGQDAGRGERQIARASGTGQRHGAEAKIAEGGRVQCHAGHAVQIDETVGGEVPDGIADGEFFDRAEIIGIGTDADAQTLREHRCLDHQGGVGDSGIDRGGEQAGRKDEAHHRPPIRRGLESRSVADDRAETVPRKAASDTRTDIIHPGSLGLHQFPGRIPGQPPPPDDTLAAPRCRMEGAGREGRAAREAPCVEF